MAYVYTSPSTVTPDKTYTWLGVTIKEFLFTKHNPNKYTLPPKRKSKQKIIGVTIHNTEDLDNIEDDGRNYVASTMNGNMNEVYVHYYVDDLCAWRYMPDDRISWSCSDGAAGIGNCQTICLEVIMDGVDGAENLKAKDNAARLAAKILYDNKLTINDLYTHTYWINKVNKRTNGTKDELCCIPPSGKKKCPYFIIPKWMEFKALVEKYLKELSKPAEELYRVRKTAKDAKNQIGAYKNLASAKDLADHNYGYKVYNSKGQLVYKPKTYFIRGEIKMKQAPVKPSYVSSAPTIAYLPIGHLVSVYRNIQKKDAQGVYWLKIKYNIGSGYAWVPKHYVVPKK